MGQTVSSTTTEMCHPKCGLRTAFPSYDWISDLSLGLRSAMVTPRFVDNQPSVENGKGGSRHYQLLVAQPMSSGTGQVGQLPAVLPTRPAACACITSFAA